MTVASSESLLRGHRAPSGSDASASRTALISAFGPALSSRSRAVRQSWRWNGSTTRAATTVARKRGILYGALRYAVGLRLLPTHPMDHVQWTAPRSADEVDRRSVVNPNQALQL